MKLNKLTLKDHRLFNKYLVFEPHELAAYSFANIYIWRSLYDIGWALIENSLCVFFRDQAGCFMYLGPLTEEKSPQVIKQSFAIMDSINKNKDVSRIENIEEGDLEYYRALGYLCHEKYPDYLCWRDDLVLLGGNKFKSQRASCNYFIKHYNFDWAKLKLTDKDDCLGLFNSWAALRKTQSRDDLYRGMLEDSSKVIKEAFANYQQLGLEGIAVRIDKKINPSTTLRVDTERRLFSSERDSGAVECIKAFSFGCRLNNETFCILYEITDLSIKGLTQFIFRQFCRELKDYKYINIMDDSGLENLRKVKLSYRPRRLIPAYIVTRDARRY